MSRGKQQVLFNYLPGKTFDFERGPIAKVSGIRGLPSPDLNERVIVQRIADQARDWQPQFRPALPDRVLNDPGRFVVLDPLEVDAQMYPKVFWCDNRQCQRVIDFTSRETLPNTAKCPVCRSGNLRQMRFIRIHHCGAIEPLLPPACPQCKRREVALDDRGSERISAFRWRCTHCSHAFSLYGGPCRNCAAPGDGMNIEVHRAGRAYYGQSAVLLNIPHKELQSFFDRPDWAFIIAGKFLRLSSTGDRPLASYTAQGANPGAAAAAISEDELESLLGGGGTPEEIVARLRQRREMLQRQTAASAQNLQQDVCQTTGLQAEVWDRAKLDLLEAVIPFDNAAPGAVTRGSERTDATQLLPRIGAAEIALVNDYTIINATYGFSRAEYSPDRCWLNPFPPDRTYQGRLPIFVDKVQADAILLSLDPERVLRWLSLNAFQPMLPPGTDAAAARRSYFIKLFDEAPLHYTLTAADAERRMVFGLLHSLSHLCVKQAALLCGLERNSLSEYLIPKALSLSIYPNNRFGATIGALTALFEQTLGQWVSAIRLAKNCVYDPVCHDHSGNCHACTHLAETSCRFFNLNLSRAFLFGGPDGELGEIRYGYFSVP
jgi:hypothetical protein